MGFGPRFCKWVMAILSSGRFSILINGKPGSLFSTQRGVRQGDPCSPLIFLDVKVEEIWMLENILHGFELTSGLRVNFAKSSIIPIGQCDAIEDFATVLGCKHETLPFIYLGLPLGAPFKATTIWTPFIERIENRLMGWKRTSLSKGGRLVLIRSCLLSIPTYYLSLFPLPSKLAQRMERLVRGFLWGEKATKKPFCLVRWQICGTPKTRGGLGIRGFNLMNKALISKWIWRCAKEKSSLWRAVVRQKHGLERGGIFPKIPRASHGVGLWIFIAQHTPFIHAHSSFDIGNGKSTRFWMDRWCHSRLLKDLAPTLFSIVKRKHSLVSEVLQLINGQYSIQLQFYASIDYDFMHEVVLIHNLVFTKTLDPSRDDELVWEDDSDDGFSVSAAYDKYLEPTAIPSDYPSHKVWKKGTPRKCQFLAWTDSLNRIATFDLLRQRRIVWVNGCLLCTKDQESSNHLFIHCSFSRGVWNIFFQSFGQVWTMPESVLDLYAQWSWEGDSRRGGIIWSFLPHAILWCIWAERNNGCFHGIDGSVYKVFWAVKGLQRM